MSIWIAPNRCVCCVHVPTDARVFMSCPCLRNEMGWWPDEPEDKPRNRRERRAQRARERRQK